MSTTLILSVGKILFELTCILNNVSLVFLFWGEVGKFRPSRSSRVSGPARQNLSPTRENYLGMAVRALRA